MQTFIEHIEQSKKLGVGRNHGGKIEGQNKLIKSAKTSEQKVFAPS